MSEVLKELAILKAPYTGKFSLDIIPRYFPPTAFPEVPWSVKSWQSGQGYTDVSISGFLDGFPEKREIRDLSMCYKPVFNIIPEIEEEMKKAVQETELPITVEISYYKYIDSQDQGVWVKQTNEEKIPIDQTITFLEKIEKLILKNTATVASDLGRLAKK
jgi:hypothetical protein